MFIYIYIFAICNIKRIPEFITSSRGNPILVYDGYTYRKKRQTGENCSWRCCKDKQIKCRGSIKTRGGVIIEGSENTHNHVPNRGEVEVKKMMERCRKRVREELSTSVSSIFHEELAPLKREGYGFYTTLPEYARKKSSLCEIIRQQCTNFSQLVLHPDEYTLGQSPRGIPRLAYQGYTYMFDKSKSMRSAKRHWRCTLTRTCFARARMFEDGRLEMQRVEHNHPPQLRKPNLAAYFAHGRYLEV